MIAVKCVDLEFALEEQPQFFTDKSEIKQHFAKNEKRKSFSLRNIGGKQKMEIA